VEADHTAEPPEIAARQRTERELQLLITLMREVPAAPDLLSAVGIALKRICESTGWALGEVWLPNASRSALERHHAWHEPSAELDRFSELSQSVMLGPGVGVGLGGRVWLGRQPVWVKDFSASSSPRAQIALSAGLKSALGVPIVADDEVLCVMLFFMREAREEDSHLVELASAVANQLGSSVKQKSAEQALRHARDNLESSVQQRLGELAQANRALQAEAGGRRRIEEELHTRASQQAAVAQIGQLALAGKNVLALMQEACAVVARTLAVEFCKVLELLPDQERLQLTAGVGWKDGLVGQATIAAGFDSQAGYTLLSGVPVVVADLRNETRFTGPPLLRDHEILSGMSVVIPGGSGPFGVLGAHTKRLRSFSLEDVHFLEAVANVIGEALVRHASEQTLRDSELRLRHALEFNQAIMANMAEGLYTVDERGLVTYMNPAAERLFGWSSGELIGRKMHDVTHYKHLDGRPFPAAECAGLQVLQNGATLENHEDVFIRKDGTFFDVLYSSSPIRSHGSIVGLSVVFRDVTAEKEAEKEIQRAATWLQSLIETTQDAVLSIDRGGRVVLFNPAAEQIFGYTQEEIVGQKVNVLMAEPYQSEHDSYIERYERTGVPHAIGRIRTVTAKRKSGELFAIELSVTKVSEDEDVQYAAFIRDISEKTRLQGQLVENERLAAIGTTAAKIGHELGNPLNGMSLTIQLLESRLSRESGGPAIDVSTTIKRLKNEIARLNHLTDEFRTISRRERYDFKPTQLSTLVEDVINVVAPLLDQQRIEVRASVAPDLPKLNLDSDKIKQALLNLIKNAIESMPDGGRLIVDARAGPSSVSLEITDTGMGISPDVDAFEPFMTTKKDGTGLGLVIVRQIILAHAGNISYRSGGFGDGTTFQIELPLNSH
jgi:PAS domain S-box-containing protein